MKDKETKQVLGFNNVKPCKEAQRNFEALRYCCNGILVRVRKRRRRRRAEIQWFLSRGTISIIIIIFILQSQIGALVELGRMAFRQGLSLLKFPRLRSHRFPKSMNLLIPSLLNLNFQRNSQFLRENNRIWGIYRGSRNVYS